MVGIASLTATLALALTALAIPAPAPAPLTPDPAGAKNVGNGAGQQFITGACLSDADCASGCCARLDGGGICSGPAVSFAQGKQGCGFTASGAAAAAPSTSSDGSDNSESSTDNGAVPSNAGSATGAVNSALPGAQNVGKGDGSQFITGQCFSDADCASGCCATLNGGGVCSAKAVAFDQGKQGCGFNINGGGGSAAAAATPTTAAVANQAATGGGVVNSALAGFQNVGKGDGSQFITGQCFSNADCASNCCNKNTGLCNAIGAVGIENCGFQA
ncbi:hypothetical protein VTK73DRAFT_541 [Phialemonium thermophilum]|uniref:Biotrophy-associated secreted protein 2 n=1 Tax=Phialemonium thermophilum TaxID=223376 RepID=A0ABR3XF01_9PEZI